MTKKVIEREHGEVIELQAITEWPGGQWMSEIYQDGSLMWFVGYFATEQEAYQGALDVERSYIPYFELR